MLLCLDLLHIDPEIIRMKNCQSYTGLQPQKCSKAWDSMLLPSPALSGKKSCTWPVLHTQVSNLKIRSRRVPGTHAQQGCFFGVYSLRRNTVLQLLKRKQGKNFNVLNTQEICSIPPEENRHRPQVSQLHAASEIFLLSGWLTDPQLHEWLWFQRCILKAEPFAQLLLGYS